MRTVWRAISSENNTDGGRYLGCVPTNLTRIPTVNGFLGRFPFDWKNQREFCTKKGEKKGIPRKVLAFFPKKFHQYEPLHPNSPWNHRPVTWEAPLLSHTHSRVDVHTWRPNHFFLFRREICIGRHFAWYKHNRWSFQNGSDPDFNVSSDYFFLLIVILLSGHFVLSVWL